MRFLVAIAVMFPSQVMLVQSIDSTNAPFAYLEGASFVSTPTFFTVRSRDLNVIRDFRANLRKLLTDIGFKKEEPRDQYWMNEEEWFVGRYGDSEVFRICVSERLQIYTWVEGKIVWNEDTKKNTAESKEFITKTLSAKIHALYKQE